MKKILFLGAIILLVTSGCFKTNNMENIDITVSNYPIEYLTERIYGKHSNINKIYPDDTNIKSYKLTNKLIKDASFNDLFIYNGLSNEKDIASTLLSKNKKIKIIDASFGMRTENGLEELWLNPSNYLMLAQNIKNGLKEYVNSKYVNTEIESNYKKLKIELSELDAEIKTIAQNSTTTDIVVVNDSLKFLNKYGFNVYSLESDLNEKELYTVRELLDNGYKVFMFKNTKKPELYDNLKVDYDFENVILKRIDNISEEDRKNDKDYINLINENLDLIKKELY